MRVTSLMLLGALWATPALAQQDGDAGTAAPPPPPPPQVLRHQRQVGDVQLQALIVAQPEDGDRARAAADDAFQLYTRLLTGITGPDGAVERINRQAGVAPVSVGPEALQVISEAVRICQLSDGAFDPTAGIYESLWPFSSNGFNQAPAPEELARRTPLVDCAQVALDPAARTVMLKKPGMRLSLGDLPRGLALERAMNHLRAQGFGDAVLHAGGDLIVSGHKVGKRWMVGVQDPRGSGHFAALPVAGGAVFTVGDYEEAFIERGRRMHNVLDPKTGQPARGVRSVTVLAPTAVEAAALSRAVFVLGSDKGLKLVERLPNVDAVVVDDRNRVLVTGKLANTVKYRPPTDGN